jgi:acetyl esterase/lipase/plastocyanin
MTRAPSRSSFRLIVAALSAMAALVAVLASGGMAAAAGTRSSAVGRVTVKKIGGVVYDSSAITCPAYPCAAGSTPAGGQPLQLKLDIYVPQDGQTSHPALLIVHGEGWADGTRKDIGTYATDYAQLGFTTYAADYRESCDPAHPASGDDPTLCGWIFPEHLLDLRDAVSFIRAQAPSHPTWATDPNWVGVWGSSSGGNLAGNLATGWCQGTPCPPSGPGRPDAIITWSSPLNLVDGGGQPVQPGRIAQYLGCDPYSNPPTCQNDEAARASAYYQLQPGEPPIFLMGATQDSINPLSTQTIPMYNELLADGVPTQLYQIDSSCHGIKCKAQDPGLESNSANWERSVTNGKQPTVQISAGPLHPSKASVATFNFSAANGVTTSCAIDGGAMTPCNSPSVTYTGLQPGPHTFTVQGTNGTGTGVASTLTWNLNVTSVAISDTAYTPNTAKSVQSGYVKWTNNGTMAHSVTDKSGMNLFNSGSIPVGGTFQQSFVSAGTYYYIDNVGSPAVPQGNVQISMQTTATSGPVNTNFTFTWASGAPPANFAYDVQWKKPGDTAWSSLPACGGTCTKTTTNTATLNLGLTGTYQLQARLHNLTNNKTSAWSPTLKITTS